MVHRCLKDCDSAGPIGQLNPRIRRRTPTRRKGFGPTLFKPRDANLARRVVELDSSAGEGVGSELARVLDEGISRCGVHGKVRQSQAPSRVRETQRGGRHLLPAGPATGVGDERVQVSVDNAKAIVNTKGRVCMAALPIMKARATSCANMDRKHFDSSAKRGTGDDNRGRSRSCLRWRDVTLLHFDKPTKGRKFTCVSW